jgi:hypothetical protein
MVIVPNSVSNNTYVLSIIDQPAGQMVMFIKLASDIWQ